MASISATGSTVNCAGCGYDLRGTAIGAGCPECGLPVNASLNRIRVEDDLLVVQEVTDLPKRCVITNEEVDTRPISKLLYWHHPALYLLILFNVLVFLIVVMVVRKKCQVTYYLCKAEAVKQRNKILIATLICLTCLAGMIASAVYEQWGLLLLSFTALVGTFIYLFVFAGTLKIAKAKDKDIWIRGAGPEFLHSMNEAL